MITVMRHIIWNMAPKEEGKKMSDHQVLPYCVQVDCEKAWCMSWSECCGCVMAFFCCMSVTYDGAILLWQW